MPSEVAVVPNHAAEVQIPSQLVGQSAPPRNTLLERSYELIGGVGGVRAEPSEVHFAGIARDVDKVATLRLVNASAAPTRMHIHPPSTPFFSMSIVKRGRVMPGMAEELTITFKATDMRHYRDQIRVHTEAGNMVVPLHAYPAIDPTQLPTRVDFGFVALGSVHRRELPIGCGVNVEFEYTLEQLEYSGILGEIEVGPMHGVIPANGHASIALLYSPKRLASARLVLQLRVSQPNFSPHIFEVVGSSQPGDVRKRHLKTLSSTALQPDLAVFAHATAADAEALADGLAADVADADEYGENRGSTLYDDIDGSFAGTATNQIQRSVLLAPPTPRTLAAAAAAKGGGAGRGDAVTKAMAMDRRHKVGSKSVPVRRATAPPPRVASANVDEVDGYRIPAHIGCQTHANALLTQQKNKRPIAELRAAIDKQTAEAERQAREAEAASAHVQSVDEQLRAALARDCETLIAALERRAFQTGHARSTVDKANFRIAADVLGVAGATEADLDALFDELDVDGLGEIECAELRRVRRGVAKPTRLDMLTTIPADAEPAELDIALQDHSRQLKELLFSREIGAIEAFEREKEVKSQVARGAALLPASTIEATVSARAEAAAAEALAKRQEARARESSELSSERVPVSEELAAATAAITPAFDKYSNDNFSMRQQALAAFQQGMRTALLRARVNKRLQALQASLQRAGISLDNRQAIRQLVVARSRVSTQQGDASKPRKPAQPQGADEIDISTLITPSTIAPFVFPSKEIESDRADAEPLTVEPLEPFNEIKCFALRVPRRYQQMQYEQLPMTVPGTFPALLTSRTLRSGAAHEDGLPPIVGAADAFPITPLPPPLLRPPAADAVDAEDAVAAASFPALTLPPKPLLAPPQHNETSPELQLRATVLPANETWLTEATGLSSARSLLSEPTISTRWRASRQPWGETEAALPLPMGGVASRDVASELSEDESDTEIVVAPPTEARLKQIFVLPPPFAARTDAAAQQDSGEHAEIAGAAETAGAAGEMDGAVQGDTAAQSHVEGMLLAAEEAQVDSDRVMPVDAGSQLAVAEAVLQGELALTRRRRRLQLTRALVAFNDMVDNPKYKLDCII